MQFVRCEAPGAEDLPCEVSLASIDEAREKVVKPNHIQGILAASHPHSLVGGLWFRPVPGLFSKSPAGLTGLAGMIQARLPHPALAVAIVGSRLAFFRMPEPEIQLAPGVDLIVRAASSFARRPSHRRRLLQRRFPKTCWENWNAFRPPYRFPTKRWRPISSTSRFWARAPN